METAHLVRSQAMLRPLQQLQVTNFRGLRSATVALHPQVTVFFGENAAGKTTSLDALTIAFGAYVRRVQESRGVTSLLPVSHTLQFSKAGTDFDLVQDGGQDNLFFFRRISADLDIGSRHTVVLLYQPLTLKSSVLLGEELVADETIFAAGTPMNFKYGFDYTRGSYLYDFQEDPERELALGLSIQLRNATIDYQSADGSQQVSNRNIGLVPIIKFRTRQPLAEDAYWGFEADGFYAPVSYLNGDNNEVVGAILDSNARLGVQLSKGVDAFASLRYVGGGSVGTNDDVTGPGDRYTKNWIHTAALSVGFSLR